MPRFGLLSIPNVICFLTAFFLLAGRWTPARLFSGEDSDVFYWEPRFWSVVALWVTIPIATLGNRTRANTSLGCDGPVFLFALLFAYLGVTSLWSTSFESSAKKLYELSLIFCFGSGIWAWFRIGNNARDHADRVWMFLLYLTGMMAILAVVGGGAGRQAVLGGGPNVFGRNMGLLAIVGISMLGRQRKKGYGTLMSALIAVVGLLFVVTSGSRGALASIIVALAVYSLFDRHPIIRKALFSGFLAVIAILLLLTTEVGRQAQDSFNTRVLRLTLETQHTAGRGDLYADAYKLGKEYPWFGMGLDGFQAVYGTYPHNIFLELFCDGGQVAIALFLLALLRSIRGIVMFRNRVHLANLAAFVHVFCASQFSGDLYDSRGVFIFLGLTLTSASHVPQPLPSTCHDGSRQTFGKMLRHPFTLLARS